MINETTDSMSIYIYIPLKITNYQKKTEVNITILEKHGDLESQSLVSEK